MASANNMQNPLAINLRRQTRALLDTIPKTSPHYAALRDVTTTRQLLASLSSVLAGPAFTKTVASLFRPLLVDLCARWLESSTTYTEEQLFALCYLVEVHEELFPILNQLLLKNHEGGPLSFVTASQSHISIDIVRLQRHLLAYYRILQANRELPEQLLWPLTPLSNLIWTPHLDNGLRLLAIRCYALQSGMGEAERLKLEQEVLGEPCGVDCPLNYGQELDGTETVVDGWVMPAFEVQRVRAEREELATNCIDFYSGEETVPCIQDDDLCPYIANVHGVLLLKSSTTPSPSTSLIPTPSSTEALRQMALHISLCLPTLLTSAPSAGKALLLSHLASTLHSEKQNHIVTVHLADTSLDPRSLLGSYISSSVHPGTFEWKEGVLVRAMREGKWVVFEDVDRASNEVLGVIKPLVESLELGKWIGGRARLTVPSQRTVVAHHHFMLFATRSMAPTRNGTFHPPTFLGSHKFSEVVVTSSSAEELSTIINAKFPRLAGCAAQVIIKMWNAIEQLPRPASSRDIGLRELQQICQRIDHLLPSSQQTMDIQEDSDRPLTFQDIFPNPTLREDIYLEARDVFFGAGTSTAATRAHVKSIAELVGDALSLDHDRQQWLLHGKSSVFDVERDSNGAVKSVCLGRTRLPAQNVKLTSTRNPRPFAMHKPALSLMSRIANAISHREPVLLTGETGTGKTSAITHLAALLNQNLVSLNLSHQTESSDLIGGLKPIDSRVPGSHLQEKFLALFGATFSRRKNEKFETEVRKAVNECKWKRAVGLWKESVRLALERLHAKDVGDDRDLDDGNPRKRRKTERSEPRTSPSSWSTFLHQVEEFEVQHVHGKGRFAFGFVEGPLVRALRSGDWILLDEINLASPETLECISALLRGPMASITLTEHGSLEPIPRHPNFRLFACMNPATDVGKKDLPPTIRSRFTEIDVPSPDADKETLLSIVTQYIGHVAIGDKRIIMDIAEFYTAVKHVAQEREIADGSNHRPHFSMRTLARALTFASDTASAYSLRRSVWEGCLMAFTMVLDSESAQIVTNLARKHLLANVSNPRSMLKKEPPLPTEGVFVKFGPFFLEKGNLELDLSEEYVMTPSVEQKLIDLSRIILTRRFPVLIEGPTSSGKTSSIEYLAKRTGHRFIRINNHEHTDIQEYLGSYVSDPLTGKLVFKDGLLVQALRQGHWIVLDELNLAPTDVLEALNRLLDDNRELVIPETQEVVRPHPHFMLFATQNPPGLYAGRKILSRAFRNRFLEVHFEDVPQGELESILCQRCQIAPSYGKRIVAVFRELQKRRQTGRVFESRHGFATLRDLFRWAGRDAIGYQELAENGYMLLAERARRPEDKVVVKEVIEAVMGVMIDEEVMYDLHRSDVDMNVFLGHSIPSSPNVVWTKAMQRLYTLVCRGLKFNEPILLVGETGSGKTSVCQVFADSISRRLLALNCHQNTETADLIGGLRPIRNRSALQAEAVQFAISTLRYANAIVPSVTVDGLCSAISVALKVHTLDPQLRLQLEEAHQGLMKLNAIFEWHDGPLIEAMRHGDVFLLDEISLADDSVLERLNSVLESGRSMVLAERGGADPGDAFIRAVDAFKLVATMNPGGDYGKKELSPALRNRFTEIWVPAVDDRADLELIINNLWRHLALQMYTSPLLDFVEWLSLRVGDRSIVTLRDILAWIVFMNSSYDLKTESRISSDELFHHAAHMTYLDGLGSLPQLSGYRPESLQEVVAEALQELHRLVPLIEPLGTSPPVYDPANFVQLGSFAIPRGDRAPVRQSFNFSAPTTSNNAMRVIRACQVSKPILLEGSPGVGKTTLVAALAILSGHQLCRINLSDQTDLIDLFGSDLPVEGGAPGEFAWKDAEFLQALQEGHWVLLDEMNLAPQAVLEGLNAVLDHRGTVYIPELNKSFNRHPSFRIFAAQNPLHQGGGRKGLPKSFVNRFTKVYIQELTLGDLHVVSSQLFPEIDESILRAMILFNVQLNEKVSNQRSFGQDGSPWEFNLRDVIRWATLMSKVAPNHRPQDFLRSVYLQRFRSTQDRLHASSLFEKVFGTTTQEDVENPPWTVAACNLQFGHFIAERRNKSPKYRPRRILRGQLSVLESLGLCLSQSWLAILTGSKSSGKSAVIRTLAEVTGNPLCELPINHATDAMDILGSFEQVDSRRRISTLLDDTLRILELELCTISGSQILPEYLGQALSLRNQCEIVPTHRLRNVMARAFDLVAKLVSLGSRLTEALQSILTDLEKVVNVPVGAGVFEWVDGPLVKAMKNGQWILLDGANLCSPSVLDRLNSLCETNGVLTLSERGFVDGRVQLIKPHPDFRLLMSVDPHFGELSRAMRNRGIEIFMEPTGQVDNADILLDFYRLPLSINFLDVTQNGRSIFFEAARRGLRHFDYHKATVLSTTGRSLDHDSALAYLVDHAPSFLTPEPAVESAASMIMFLAQVLVPRYESHLRHFVANRQGLGSVADFLRVYPGAELSRLIDGFRYVHAKEKHSPEAFVLDERMNFYWNSHAQPQKDVNSNEPTGHALIFEALNLSASIFISSQEVSFKPVIEQAFVDEKVQHVQLAVQLLIEEIQNTSREVLQNFTPTSVALISAQQASTLLSYSVHLQKALSSTSFDFSSLYAISHWLLDSMQYSPKLFSSVLEQVSILHQAVSLSKGRGLFAFWSTFYLEGPSSELTEAAILADRMAASLEGRSNAFELRRQAISVVSLEMLPPSLTTSLGMESLPKLRETLKKCLSSSAATTTDAYTSSTDPLASNLELCVLSLSAPFADSRIVNMAMEEFIRVSTESHSSFLRIVPLQHFIWAHGADMELAPQLFSRAQIVWLEGLWNMALESTGISGPSILLHPIELHKDIESCDMDKVQLSSLVKHEAVIRKQAHHATFMSSQQEDRLTQLMRVLLLTLIVVSSTYSSSFETATWESIKNFSFGGPETFSKSLSSLLSLLLQSNDESYVSSVRDVFKRTVHLSSSRAEGQQMGLAWIALSRCIFTLFVPDTPMDPAAVQNTTRRLLELKQIDLNSQIHLHQQLESLVTGNTTNEAIRHLQPQLDEILSQMQKIPTFTQRKDISRLHLFWSEVIQFQNSVIPPTKVDNLLIAMLHGDQEVALRQTVLQESLAGFYQRLDSLYPEFTDITVVLKLAIQHMRLGLQIVSDSVSLSNAGLSSATLASSLLSYPLLRCSSEVMRNFNNVAPSGTSFLKPILLVASASASELSLGIKAPEILSAIDQTFEQALGIWLIDRAREKEENERDNSLYRRNKTDHHAISDAQMEEEDFIAMFPTYEDAFDAANTLIDDEQRSMRVLASDSSALLKIHFAVTEAACSTRVDAFAIFSQLRKAAIQNLSSYSLDALPDHLDRAGIAFRLSFLRGAIRDTTTFTKEPNTFYNFYTDANIQELKTGATVVDTLRMRLQLISEEWPDQMVLRHLIERCEAILSISSTSPVAKVLTSVEQLLVQTDDWEMFANRENSIKSQREDLVKLVVNWRRLELSCWQTLLDAQATTFTDELSDWWFRLYDAALRGPLSSFDHAHEDKNASLESYLDTLIPLLDDFIKTSPLGQFHYRMRLLRSFGHYIDLTLPLRTTSQQSIMRRVSGIFLSTHSYFELFSDGLQKHLVSQKSALEKEIKGFIKLASWKDVNVQALKQSAKKTHHQLYKIIRKFRDVLRQPIHERLLPSSAGESESQPMAMDQPEPVACRLFPSQPQLLSNSSQGHLVNLRGTLSRFQDLISTRVQPFIQGHSAEVVDDLAVEIITTSKALATKSVPASLSGSLRERHEKALLVRKRKAWADLLKELKQAGLPSNVKPEVLRQNTSQVKLREKPTILPRLELGIDTARGEGYFLKLCGALPLLRGSISNHHADLTTRELHRGEVFLEASFYMAVDLRSWLAVALDQALQMNHVVERMVTLSSGGAPIPMSNLQTCLTSIGSLFAKICHSLSELRSDAVDASELGLNPPKLVEFLGEITDVVDESQKLRGDLNGLLHAISGTSLPFLTPDERNLVLRAEEHISHVQESLERWKKENPAFSYLLNPLQRWLHDEALTPISPSPASSQPGTSKLESLINSLLVCIQSLASRCPSDTTPSNDDEPDKYILKGHQRARELTHLLNLDGISSRLDDFLSDLSSCDDIREPMATFLPFLELYLALVKEQLAAHNNWTKTLFKLDFVLCSLLQTLCQQGFCKPPPGDERDTEGETSEATGGVGIGEGSGAENVSKDIEEESQIEGLQGEESEDKARQEKNDEGDTIEMDDDFGGALEDVSEAGSDQDQDRESDAEEEADLDETLGELDNMDPSAVDEKMWGDEQGPEGSGDDDKANQDHSKDDGGSSEVVAKESKEQKRSQESAQEPAQEEGESERQDDEMGDDEAAEDSNDPNVSGAPMEEHVQEANTLNLPDNMDLDAEGEREGAEDEMDDDIEEEGDEHTSDDPGDFPMDDPNPEPSAGNETSDDQRYLPEQEGDVQAESEEAAEDPAERDDEQLEEAIAQPDISTGDGMMDPNDITKAEPGESGSTGEVGMSQGATGQDSAAQEKTENDNAPTENSLSMETVPANPSGSGSGSSGIQQGQASSEAASQPQSNPLRSLGDALQEIRQRFDEILDAEPSDIPKQQAGESTKESQIEYLRPEDTDHEMQALGPAGEEQAAKLDQLNIISDDMQVDEALTAMDVDTSQAPEVHETVPRPFPTIQKDQTGVEQHGDIEGAILRSSLNLAQDDGAYLDLDRKPGEVEAMDDSPQDVELELRAWRTADYPEDGAERIWRLYESLTHDLAYALCEQLRLILEPTLATRLKGDYRTGKRLNMKKVIAYIASDYTKDKIWLRRTKPSQREYQVLISIDDSRSMAESHSIHLAYQTLALISKALGRLESGDIAIAKFGAAVDLLHGFDEGPFADQAGIKVVNAFRFNQKATNVLSLMETSLNFLSNARERKARSSSSAADLWQLQIIVSDGMCQDHEKLRTILRKAEEQRVMVVFIILDSLQSATSQATTGTTQTMDHQSILSMDKAEFKDVNGKMELQLRKYLDSFPFEYYVVLRNVEALPDVLAGTLKQFFERVSEQ